MWPPPGPDDPPVSTTRERDRFGRVVPSRNPEHHPALGHALGLLGLLLLVIYFLLEAK